MPLRHRYQIVYPGHPVTLALLIMTKYDCLESAVALGHEFPSALEDHDIPGSGDSISRALGLLKRITRGEDPAKAVADAERVWTVGGAGGYPNAVRAGQEEAEVLKPEFFRRVDAWVRVTSSAVRPIRGLSLSQPPS